MPNIPSYGRRPHPAWENNFVQNPSVIPIGQIPQPDPPPVPIPPAWQGRGRAGIYNPDHWRRMARQLRWAQQAGVLGGRYAPGEDLSREQVMQLYSMALPKLVRQARRAGYTGRLALRRYLQDQMGDQAINNIRNVQGG